MKETSSRILKSLFCAGLLLVSANVYAQDEEGRWQYKGSSNVQLLYGEDFDPANENLATLTFEHAGSYGAFEHFGFIDVFWRTNLDEDTTAYGEYYPKLSLSRLGLLPMEKDLLLKDVLIGAGINAGKNFRAYLVGPIWKFNIPGFDLAQIETYYYKQESFDGTYQITPSWDVPLPLSDRWKFRTRGFIDFIGDGGQGKAQIIAQPQLLLDIGNFWNRPGAIFVGTEWRYWHNKGGADGVTESVPQIELMLTF